MPQVREKSSIQYCIDAHLFNDVLSAIPKEVTIKKLQFEVGDTFGKLRVNPSNKLKALGVSYIRLPSGEKEITGTFEELSRSKMKENIDTICQLQGTQRDKARVRALHLEYDGCLAVFTRTRKEIRPDKTDQRRKLTVLGMTSHSTGINKLLAKMSLGKYECKWSVEETRRVICAKIGR